MIGIQLEGDSDFLDIFQDTAISFRMENPIFGDPDKLSPGSFSYPFDLPGGEISPKNAAKLKHPDVIESNGAYVEQLAKLFFDGVPFKYGKLKAHSGNLKNISANFTFGLNSISSDLKKARLRDVVNENIVISASSITKKIYLKSLFEDEPLSGETFTINGIDSVLVGNLYAATNGNINSYYDANMIVDGDIWLPRSTHVTSGSTPGGIPAPYLEIALAHTVNAGSPVIEYSADPLIDFNIIADRDRFDIEANLGNYHAEFDTFMQNYIDGSYPDNKVRFPTVFNAKPFDGDVRKKSPLVNGFYAAGLIPNLPNNNFNINSIQPFILLKHVLDKIATTFNFEWEGDFYTHSDLPTMLLWNSALLDTPMPFIGESNFIFWRRSFNITELVPDISVIDLLKALQSRYNLGIYYNEATKKVTIQFRDSIIKSYVYKDITSISSNVQSIHDDRLTGYTFKVTREETDLLSVDETVVEGVAEHTHDVLCGVVSKSLSLFLLDGLVTAPYVSQLKDARFGLRVFHYAGTVNNGAYSYGSAVANGVTLDESITAVHTRWFYWLRSFTNRRGVKIYTAYGLRDLINYDWTVKRRYNRYNYLVKSISVRLSSRGVAWSEVELYTT